MKIFVSLNPLLKKTEFTTRRCVAKMNGIHMLVQLSTNKAKIVAKGIIETLLARNLIGQNKRSKLKNHLFRIGESLNRCALFLMYILKQNRIKNHWTELSDRCLDTCGRLSANKAETNDTKRWIKEILASKKLSKKKKKKALKKHF